MSRDYNVCHMITMVSTMTGLFSAQPVDPIIKVWLPVPRPLSFSGLVPAI